MDRWSKALDVTASSLVDLKAELLRKQEQYHTEKLNPELRKRKAGLLKTNKKKINFGEKNKVNPKKQRKKEREEKKKKKILEEDEETRKKIALSSDRLRAKTKLYEKMQQSNMSKADQEKYLVDFEMKQFQHIPGDNNNNRHSDDDEFRSPSPAVVPRDEEWVDFVDSLGRQRRCMRRDLARLQAMDDDLNRRSPDSERSVSPTADQVNTGIYYDYDQPSAQVRMPRAEDVEQPDPVSSGPVHYESVRESEVRVHGTGYFQFSTDEDERLAQMAALKKMREETTNQRSRRDRLKQRREDAKQKRLEKIQQRKLARGGGSLFVKGPDKDKGESTENEPEEEKQAEKESDEEDNDEEDDDKTDVGMDSIDDLLSSVRHTVEQGES